MVNLLKVNANNLNDFIVEKLSKEVNFKFEKDELIVLIEALNENGLKMIVKLPKNSLDQQAHETISWKYLADPKDPNTAVTRKCSISSLGTTIQEIVENKRFDKDYLKELENSAQ
jgi:hypothetical protein